MKILLIGNPNVGKSVIFHRLTGVKTIVSNYPGTTVEFSKGFMRFFDLEAEVIDVPGTYSLHPTSKAEDVAVKLIDEADVLINIVDATNLERNLHLTLELINKKEKPLIVVLTIWDETKHKGIEIDVKGLEELLGVPVVTTCGLTGEGIKDLVFKIKQAKLSPLRTKKIPLWNEIGNIVEKVQKLHHRHHTFLDIMQELSIKPPFAFFFALVVVCLSFVVIRFIGEGFINHICDPFFEHFYNPLAMKLSGILGEGGFLHTILIGNLVEGQIEYSQSFGVLTTGIYVPFAMVMPYVLSFYFILGLLEDSGYLPRLAVLSDRVFHRLGLHGYAIIPTILGLGCNVPGALSTRLFEARREKFIAATLLAVAVPCMAQSAMIVGLLGRFGGQYVAIVFFTLFSVWFILGFFMNRFLSGRSPEILIEIPSYRIPHLKTALRKLWMRISWFIKEAVPLVLLGIVIVNVLYYLKVIDLLGMVFAPIVTKIWGLPKEVIGALIIGFLRKDVAVGMLRPLDMSLRQLIVGASILGIYFPCAATFFVLVRELGAKDMIKSIFIMLSCAVSVGAILNVILIWGGIR
ncbi:MAG: ferrous iron transporter B [Candidatus Omnitrophota bacterium]|nr:MAG: ferrous iron transporter B [Candidatus Omnitrophota bacterium]